MPSNVVRFLQVMGLQAQVSRRRRETDSGSVKVTEERRLSFSSAGSRERPGSHLQPSPGRRLGALAAGTARVSSSPLEATGGAEPSAAA